MDYPSRRTSDIEGLLKYLNTRDESLIKWETPGTEGYDSATFEEILITGKEPYVNQDKQATPNT